MAAVRAAFRLAAQYRRTGGGRNRTLTKLTGGLGKQDPIQGSVRGAEQRRDAIEFRLALCRCGRADRQDGVVAAAK